MPPPLLLPPQAGLRTPCPAETLSPDFLTVASWTDVYAADAQVGTLSFYLMGTTVVLVFSPVFGVALRVEIPFYRRLRGAYR